MASWQDSIDQQALDNERYRLKDSQELVVRLGAELAGVLKKEHAANRIFEEIEDLTKVHPEEVDSFDWRQAKAALPKLAAKRTELETRIASAKRGIEVIEANIKKFDLPKLARLQKIRELFQQIAG